MQLIVNSNFIFKSKLAFLDLLHLNALFRIHLLALNRCAECLNPLSINNPPICLSSPLYIFPHNPRLITFFSQHLLNFIWGKHKNKLTRGSYLFNKKITLSQNKITLFFHQKLFHIPHQAET